MIESIIEDQYIAARSYFLCIIGMLFFESLLTLPKYLLSLIPRRKLQVKSNPASHNSLYTIYHKLATLPSFLYPLTNHRIPNLLRLALFIGLNFLWGWNSNEFSTDYKLYGWLTIANGGLGFLLATRSSLFQTVARIPSPKILMYHRWIGRATVAHATIHFALNTQHDIVTDQLATAFSSTRIQIGVMAWLSLAIIFITSISYIRRRFFEVFYYSHFLFLVFAVGAMIHATKGPEFIMPGLGLWVIDRAIRFYHNFRKSRVTSLMHYPGDVTKFSVEGVSSRRPGQIAWIQIPGISFLNWHPFTIASAPGEDAVVAVRGLGGYTKKLQCMYAESSAVSTPRIAGEKDNPLPSMTNFKVRMDGPYGLGGIQWASHPVVVLVAGGVGITPGVAIAGHIIKQANMQSTNDTEQAMAMQSIHLLWIVKDLQHVQWFEVELLQLYEMTKDATAKVSFDITIHVSGTMNERLSEDNIETLDVYEYSGPGNVIQGRPDLVEYFSDIKARREMDAVVNVCGPRSLISSVRKAAAKTSSQSGFFHVEEEVFEL